jgi:hypothetical protein
MDSTHISPELLRETAVSIMRSLQMEPDPWQVEVLAGGHKRMLLNCCRQAGKSTTVAVLSLMEAVGNPGTKVLLLSRSFRQARELFSLVADFHERLGSKYLASKTAHELKLANFSRILCLPCKEETVRGYANVGLLVIDEAARVPDDFYRTVRPMLAVSDGRLVCLSTPYGKRGFFYNAWARGGADWHRIEVPADKIARIKPSVLESDRRELGESWYRQEYGCSFEALEGLVYPDFARCVVPGPAPDGTRVGGMDFGLRNPFAAIWGVLDRDGVLWLTGEHYSRDKSLAFHAEHLPRDVTWYGDPAGARDIKELRCAGFVIRRGDNEQRPGIGAVRARLENGTLRVVQGSCPNLLAEAGLYQYDPEATESETPKKEYDHALDALRYLVSRIDARFMARGRKRPVSGEPAPETPPPASPVPALRRKKWLSIYNEELWTRLW